MIIGISILVRLRTIPPSLEKNRLSLRLKFRWEISHGIPDYAGCRKRSSDMQIIESGLWKRNQNRAEMIEWLPEILKLGGGHDG